MIPKTIFCLGDSLTFGARDEFHRGYPAELSHLFWQNCERSVHCFNSGVSGETSADLLKRAWKEISMLEGMFKYFGGPDTALLLIGTNDTMLQVPPEVYGDTVVQIVDLLTDSFKHIGVGLLPPVYGPGLCNYPQNSQNLVNEYNRVLLSDLEERVFYADFQNMHGYIVDTVHFSNLGYKKMAEIWYNAIVEETEKGR